MQRQQGTNGMCNYKNENGTGVWRAVIRQQEGTEAIRLFIQW